MIMTIATQASNARLALSSETTKLYAISLILPALVLGWPIKSQQMRKRRICRVVLPWLALVLVLLLPSCSGVSNGGGGGGAPPTNPVTYQVTVTGTSAGTIANAGQSTVVTLVVD